jgi:hypothetical protein
MLKDAGWCKMMGEITKLSYTTSKSRVSLKTTVPVFIVKQFGLKAGDHLDWSIGTDADGNLIIQVKPIKKMEENEG